MFRSSRWRVLLVLSLILAGGAFAVASLYPTPSMHLPWGNVESSDLVFHGVAFGVLVILGGIIWHRLTWVAVTVLVYSTLLEGTQIFVPGREFFLSDLAANVVGILAGLVILAPLRRQQRVPVLEDKDL